MSVAFLTAHAEQLQTERLLLEPLAQDHAAEMAFVLDDPKLHRYVGGRPLPLEELRRRYERQARGRSDDGSERWFNWIVRDRFGEAAGYVQATVRVASGRAAVAWVIGPRFQGNGYGREAASAMSAWLWHLGVTAMTADIHPENTPSEAVAREIGLAPTSTVVDGEVRWQSVRVHGRGG